MTIELQNSKAHDSASDSSVTNTSIETEVSSINDSVNGIVESNGIERFFAGKLGKETAELFLSKNTVFPCHTHFLPKKKENSFYSMLKDKIDSRSLLADKESFDDFFINNLKLWNRCCNSVRTELVNRCKLRYFSKCDHDIMSCCNDHSF